MSELQLPELQPTSKRPSVASSERRGHPRFPIEIEVTLRSEHNFFTGFTENISEGGLFIATHQLKPVGFRFQVTFTLEDAQPIELLCEVRWIRPYHENLDVPAGMGVRFVDIAPETEALITAFLNAREPIFYED